MNKVTLIAVISIIFVTLFPILNGKISCYTGFSINIFDYVLESEEKSKKTCNAGIVEEIPPPPILDEELFLDPPEGYLPISYYEKKDEALQCSPSNTYYHFSIPENSIPYAVGTKTISISNKNDWDMWMKIASIETNNHLKITSSPKDYKTFSSGSTLSFTISWSWNPPKGYTGNKGSASVYFNAACSEPIPDPPKMEPVLPKEIEKPITPYLTVMKQTDTTITVSWNMVEDAQMYILELVKSPTIHDVMYSGSKDTYTFEHLIPGTDYEFHLRAKNSVGESEEAVAFGKTTGNTNPPGIPSKLRVNDTTDSTISLIWFPFSDDSISYALYRDGALIYEGSDAMFTDQNLRAGTSYSYTLYAKNAYGYGEPVRVTHTTTNVGASPNDPDIPSKPDNPEIPSIPNNPRDPGIPNNPKNPGIPNIPGNPKNPGIPEIPGNDIK